MNDATYVESKKKRIKSGVNLLLYKKKWHFTNTYIVTRTAVTMSRIQLLRAFNQLSQHQNIA